MSIAWLLPAALAGVALVIAPIAIHLLVRQHTRTLLYPSLRFLRQTQLSAFRRRHIQDAMVLMCRVAIVALAAVALAGPVLQTPSRRAAQAGRLSQVVVTVGQRPVIADALADAVRWLDRQPASAREIVVKGELRRGAITETDLVNVPIDIGIRFEPAPAASEMDATQQVLVLRNGALNRVDRVVHFGSDVTSVTEGVATRIPIELVTIVAAAAATPLAEAALRAALAAGIPWTDFSRRVVLVWQGADESRISRLAGDARVIRMLVPSPEATAADAVRTALLPEPQQAGLVEPVMISAGELSAWSRRPGPPSPNAPLADEGDRRWLWALVLMLLALEWWLRRDSRSTRQSSSSIEVEARVA